MTDDVRIEPAAAAEPSADLAKQVRALRRWMIALTVVVALFIVGTGSAIWVTYAGFTRMFNGMGPIVSPEDVAAVREEYEQDLGSDLDSLDVRVITFDLGETLPPFPFGPTAPKEQGLYIRYRLKGSALLFANVSSPGGDPDTGLLPMRGSLGSVMTKEQFRAIIKAYEAETKAPFGGVHHYANRDQEGPPATTIAVGGEDYATKDLWVVSPGIDLNGNTFDPDTQGSNSRALVFYEDRKTGAFHFLGMDDSGNWTMW